MLGGGGSTGHAWLVGVVAGLLEGGLDVTDADLVVGTSAGSTAAAQIVGRAVPGLFVEALEAPPVVPDVRRPVTHHLARMRRIIDESDGPADLRRRLGAVALAREDASLRWRRIVATRLAGLTWPDGDLRITAVDADTGGPVVFDRHSGVELVDAVAASCSSGFAYALGDRRFIDGGHRTNAENADLAAGYGRVLVLAPFGGRSWTPPEWGLHLATQVDELRAGGSRVEVVVPPEGSDHLFGPNAMDLTHRPTAARLGHEAGFALADPLTDLWGSR